MEPLKKPTSDETTRSFDLPAPYVNRFFVTMGEVVRLTFGEQDTTNAEDPTVKMRASVALSAANLLQLRDLLVQVSEMVRAVPVDLIEPEPPEDV